MRPILRERLAAAVGAIAIADPGTMRPGHLADRLTVVFLAEDWGAQADVLMQARSWSVIVGDGRTKADMDRARDAIGLLWAVAEEGL